MEINLKEETAKPSSKWRGVGKRNTCGQLIETLQILPSQNEDQVKTSHACRYFPKGQRIKRSPRSRISYRPSDGSANSSLVLIRPKLPLYTERTMNLYMPRLTFNHGADASEKSRRCSPSPHVANNKSCLKKKGLNINNLYSFRQRRKVTNDQKTLDRPYTLQMIRLQASGETDSFRRRTAHGVPFKTSGNHMNNGLREYNMDSPVFVRLMTGLERETNIPGHVRPEDANGNILGRVITKTHQHNLLTQEKPVIPAVFYYK